MEINLDCPCRNILCERRGDCDACKKHHHASRRVPMTTCERIKSEAERKNKRGK